MQRPHPARSNVESQLGVAAQLYFFTPRLLGRARLSHLGTAFMGAKEGHGVGPVASDAVSASEWAGIPYDKAVSAAALPENTAGRTCNSRRALALLAEM